MKIEEIRKLINVSCSGLEKKLEEIRCEKPDELKINVTYDENGLSRIRISYKQGVVWYYEIVNYKGGKIV